MIETAAKRLPPSSSRLSRTILQLALLLVVGSLALSPFSKRALEKILPIAEVRVTSEWPLTPGEIQSWLPELTGQSLFWLRAKDLLEFLKTKEWVANATIKKNYPDQLLIDVQTLRPVARVILRGEAYLIDESGRLICKATSRPNAGLDLSVISFRKEAVQEEWNLVSMLEVLAKMQKALESDYKISEITLDDQPTFRIFLLEPAVEAVFDVSSWEKQLPILRLLLHSPPARVGSFRRIDLSQSQKAILLPK